MLLNLILTVGSSRFRHEIEDMIGIDPPPPQPQFPWLRLLWSMLVVEVHEGSLFLFEAAFGEIEDEGQWDELKHVYLVAFAVVIKITEEVLLVGELVMVLHVVQRLLEYAVVDAVLVFEAFV